MFDVILFVVRRIRVLVQIQPKNATLLLVAATVLVDQFLDAATAVAGVRLSAVRQMRRVRVLCNGHT